MGANNCAIDLADDKFDKAHYVESCKGAQIVEETCLQRSKQILIRRKDRYRKSCLGSSRAVPTSAFIVFQLHCFSTLPSGNVVDEGVDTLKKMMVEWSLIILLGS